jgi:hypothetical protein
MPPIEIAGTVTMETTIAIIDHMNEELLPLLTPNIGGYAAGRQHLWLEHAWNLKDRHFEAGHHDERLWTWLCAEMERRFNWVPELGLAVYGEVPIRIHRDDSYADWVAYTINLGEVESWYYDSVYPGWGYSQRQAARYQNETTIYPQEGSIIKFNCKNPHGPINPGPTRWAINLWRINRKFREEFDAYKEAN